MNMPKDAGYLAKPVLKEDMHRIRRYWAALELLNGCNGWGDRRGAPLVHAMVGFKRGHVLFCGRGATWLFLEAPQFLKSIPAFPKPRP